uniref:Bifunctional inhibitor/plant lipid transfer protein/seed storage helical domain-containing protein n=1 Tax=Daucus carota subsp. sativus TaxID=79200 RepID=A0A162AIR3_DAUCS
MFQIDIFRNVMLKGSYRAISHHICCSRLNQQKQCLCQYVRNPAYQKYLKSPDAKKVSKACKVLFPKC